jgi:anti-anti-sigma regulatory factor
VPVGQIEIVEVLARLQLALRRRGGRVVLSDVSEEFAGLLELLGLTPLTDP